MATMPKRSSAASTGFRLTERDARVVYDVYAHRALSSLQIARLHFPSSNRNDPIGPQCRRRLKYLTDLGYLERGEQAVTLAQGRKPYVYYLNTAGHTLLVEELGLEPETLDWKKAHNDVGWVYLDHLLRTNDVRTAIEVAAQRANLELEEWVDDRQLASPSMKDEIVITGVTGRRERAAAIPDGYASLRAGGHRFRVFVEADRATITLSSDKPYRRTWARKVRVYLTYFASEKFQERYQAYKGFRILTVTDSEERALHMKAITEAAGGKALFWFTTYEQATPENILFKPIWWVASANERSALLNNV